MPSDKEDGGVQVATNGLGSRNQDFGPECVKSCLECERICFLVK